MRTATRIALASLLVLAGCANRGDAPAADPPEATPPGTPPTAPATRAVMDSLRTEIRAEIGDAEATAAASCRAIAFGAKPCGGPWTYLVYSTEQSDAERLGRLVARYNAAEARLNAEEQRVSDCALVTRPPVELRAGRCVAGR